MSAVVRMKSIDERLVDAHLDALARCCAVAHGHLIDVTHVRRWDLNLVRGYAQGLRNIRARMAAGRR
ncbi:hypothetical protein ACIKTA_06870 [Hansschlegelia beijingensis]